MTPGVSRSRETCAVAFKREKHKYEIHHSDALMCLGVAAFAQDVQFDYDRSANFSAYKTYNWIDYKRVDPGDQLLDQDIKRAVDAQLAGKGLRRVESGGDLVVGYQAGISQEKEFDSLGGRWLGRLGGSVRVGQWGNPG